MGNQSHNVAYNVVLWGPITAGSDEKLGTKTNRCFVDLIILINCLSEFRKKTEVFVCSSLKLNYLLMLIRDGRWTVVPVIDVKVLSDNDHQSLSTYECN